MVTLSNKTRRLKSHSRMPSRKVRLKPLDAVVILALAMLVLERYCCSCMTTSESSSISDYVTESWSVSAQSLSLSESLSYHNPSSTLTDALSASSAYSQSPVTESWSVSAAQSLSLSESLSYHNPSSTLTDSLSASSTYSQSPVPTGTRPQLITDTSTVSGTAALTVSQPLAATDTLGPTPTAALTTSASRRTESNLSVSSSTSVSHGTGTAEPSDSESKSHRPTPSRGTELLSATNTISCVPGVPVLANASLRLGVDAAPVAPGSPLLLSEFIDVGIAVISFDSLPRVEFWEFHNATTSIGFVNNVSGSLARGVMFVSFLGKYVSEVSLTRASTLEVVIHVTVSGHCVPASYVGMMALSWPLIPLGSQFLSFATSTAFQSSTAASSLMGNPVTAMTATSALSMSEVGECAFSDVDELESSVSPTRLAILPEQGKYYRGCVVAGLSVYLLAAVLATSIALGLHMLELRKAKRASDGENSDDPLLILDNLQQHVAQSAAKKTMKDHFATIRCPSLGMVVVGMFHQGIASCSVSLLRLGYSPQDLLLGSCGIMVCAGIVAWCAITMYGTIPCKIVDREMQLMHEYPKLGPFLRLVLWRERWEDESSTHFKRRYLLLMDDLRLPQWTSAELLMGLLQGALFGLRVNENNVCKAQSTVICFLSLVMFVGSVVLRPRGALSSNVFLIISKLTMVLSATFGVITSFYKESDMFTSAASLTSSVSVFTSALEVAVQIAVILLTHLPSLSKRALPTKKDTGDPAGGESCGDEDSAGIVVVTVKKEETASNNNSTLARSPLLMGRERGAADEADDQSNMLLEMVLRSDAACAAGETAQEHEAGEEAGEDDYDEPPPLPCEEDGAEDEEMIELVLEESEDEQQLDVAVEEEEEGQHKKRRGSRKGRKKRRRKQRMTEGERLLEEICQMTSEGVI
jgi:hypothetical protein